MGDELKPCPFCGGEAYFSESEYNAWGYVINCKHNEGCAVGDWPEPPYDRAKVVVGDLDCCSEDREEAIAAWNRRVDDAGSIDALNRAAGNWARADAENRELRELIADMHALLQRCCDETDMSECTGYDGFCAMWTNHSDDCDLRKIEERMRALGIEVRE